MILQSDAIYAVNGSITNMQIYAQMRSIFYAGQTTVNILKPYTSLLYRTDTYINFSLENKKQFEGPVLKKNDDTKNTPEKLREIS